MIMPKLTVANRSLLQLAILSCALTSARAGEDWPVFRGDNQLSGLSTSKLPEQPALLWAFKADGRIKSSPVVISNQVLIGTGEGQVLAVSVTNGSKLWAFNALSSVDAPPMVAEGKVFFGNAEGSFYALSLADGRLLWTNTTGGQIAGSANWISGRNGQGGGVVVGSYDNKLYCFEAATGKIRWTFETQNYINGTPAVGNDQIVFGGCDGLLHIVSAIDGSSQGEVEAGSYIAGSIALAPPLAFFGHYGNRVLCADLAAKKVRWMYPAAEGGAPFFSSPALGHTQVVIGGRDGFVHCIDRSTGQSNWTFRARKDVDSSPVIVGERVVVGSQDGRVYMLSLAKGALVWSYEVGAPVSSSPAVAGGRIFVAAEDGRLYAFGKKP
jgi:eukaryotic-like serine/threonine-protein kinase